MYCAKHKARLIAIMGGEGGGVFDSNCLIT